MTCIVGIVDGDHVIIGADSAESDGSNVFVRKDAKVFRVGDFVIGCTSSFRMIQLLQYSLLLPQLPDNIDIHKYMCTDFITAVRKLFKDGGFASKNEVGEDQGGEFLVAYKDRLFRVECDYQVAEYNKGYSAVGCGAEYAIGAICALKNANINLNADIIAIHALKVASQFSIGVSEPFHFIET